MWQSNGGRGEGGVGILQPKRGLHNPGQSRIHGVIPIANSDANSAIDGRKYDQSAGRDRYFDPINKVRVIIDSASGRVVTVIPGGV